MRGPLFLFLWATSVVAAMASAPTGPAADSPPKRTWQLAVQPLKEGATAVTATLLADSTIKSGFGVVTPNLVLRYRNGRTVAYVEFDTFLGNKGRVEARVRFGEEAEETQAWTLTPDGRAAIVPGEALDFLERLKTVKRFSVQITPRKETVLTAVFSPAEVDLVIKALLSAGVKYAR